MRVIKTAFILLITTLFPIFCFAEDFLKWEAGQYVSYYLEYKNKDWEAYSIKLLGQKDEIWVLEITVNSPENQTAFILGSREKLKGEGLMEFKYFESKTIRGKDLDEKEKSLAIVKIMNILNNQNLYKIALKKGKEYKNIELNNRFIKEADDFEDPWPEFNYTLFHGMNKNIPITYLYQTTQSTGNFKLTLTSYGSRSNDFINSTKIPTYFEIENLKEFHFNEFKIKMPSSWVLKKEKKLKDKETSLYLAELGGNTHAGFLSIDLFEDKNADRIKLFEQEISDKGLSEKQKNLLGMKLIKEIPARLNGQISNTYLYFSNTGTKNLFIITLIKQEESDKLAKLSLFTNYSPKNKDFENLEKVLAVFLDVCASFHFMN